MSDSPDDNASANGLHGELARMPELLSAPKSNLILARYLYLIEVSLRELIIESLAAVSGARWYKQRLPQPIYKDSMDRLSIERASNWTSYVSQHPIYYTNTAVRLKVEQNQLVAGIE
jgi:hypothetical protein